MQSRHTSNSCPISTSWSCSTSTRRIRSSGWNRQHTVPLCRHYVLVSRRGSLLVAAERRVSFTGVINFRDLGGSPTVRVVGRGGDRSSGRRACITSRPATWSSSTTSGCGSSGHTIIWHSGLQSAPLTSLAPSPPAATISRRQPANDSPPTPPTFDRQLKGRPHNSENGASHDCAFPTSGSHLFKAAWEWVSGIWSYGSPSLRPASNTRATVVAARLGGR